MAADRSEVDLEQLADLATPWCVRVAATLRISDQLAGGPRQVAELARATACDPYALHRVLSHLAGKGVYLEAAPGLFALNPAAERLRDLSPFLELDGIGGRMAGSWETLLSQVRSGRAGYEEKFGLPFWEDLAAHPELKSSFDAMMGPHGHGVPDEDLPLSGGWGDVSSVVDVGGGTGSFLAQLLRRHPRVRGTLLDLPATVARAAALFEEAGVADRAETVGQTFFEALPAGADLYVLRKVLNDWPEKETVAILSRCAAALPASGRVVVLGGVIPDGTLPDLSIEMVLVGGRTNSLSEFRGLVHRAGLEVVAGTLGPSGHYAVECRPKVA